MICAFTRNEIGMMQDMQDDFLVFVHEARC